MITFLEQMRLSFKADRLGIEVVEGKINISVEAKFDAAVSLQQSISIGVSEFHLAKVQLKTFIEESFRSFVDKRALLAQGSDRVSSVTIPSLLSRTTIVTRIRCPSCYGKDIATEKRLDGSSECLVCGYKALTTSNKWMTYTEVIKEGQG